MRLLFTLFLLGSTLAPAQQVPTVSLTYERAPGAEACPDEVVLRRAVSARLGYDAFAADAPRSLNTRIAPVLDKLQGQVVLRDSTGKTLGTRSISSVATDCRELSEAIELAMAIAIDPQVLVRPAQPPPRTVMEPVVVTPERPREPVAEPLPVSPTRSPEPEPVKTKLSLGLGPLGSAGISAAPAFGGAVRFAARWKSFGLMADARVDVPQRISHREGHVISSTLLATLAPCFHAGSFAACGTFTAGVLRVSGEFVPPATQISSPLILAGARAQYDFALNGWFSLVPSADLQAVLTRTTVLSGADTVWVTAPVAGSLTLWAMFHFS